MSTSRCTFAALALGLLTASAAAQPSTVILVRHAERASTPPNDPELTPAGVERTRALAAALKYAGVTTVVATQFQRTQLTAAPITEALGRSPIIVRAGGPTQAHVDSVAATVRARPRGEIVLVVGHSNTIPAIIAALGGPRLPDLCDGQYSKLFIMELASPASPRLIQATFGATDPADADACSRPMAPPPAMGR